MSAPDSTSPAAPSIKGYRCESVAGTGSMGSVYRAIHEATGNTVALKVCVMSEGWDETACRVIRKMFQTEVAIGRLLDHRSILRVVDAGEQAGVLYLATEFVAGSRTLKQHVRPDALLAWRVALRVVAACARALGHAHRRGVVHRDVKPENIFLLSDEQPKVGDFGVAQMSRGDITQVTGVAGSPRYMAPEQALDRDTSPRTDIYCLGAVLYELLAGEPVFKATGISQLVLKILRSPPPAPSATRRELPEALDDVVARALAKRPEDRFPDAETLAGALEAMVDE